MKKTRSLLLVIRNIYLFGKILKPAPLLSMKALSLNKGPVGH